MSLQTDIFSALGPIVNNRVYPLVMPQAATIPAVVYTRIANNAQNVLEGGSTLDQVRIQIDTYATTFAECRNIADQVRSAIEGIKGTLQTEQDFWEVEVNYYRISQDYYIWERK